ncbi:MAG TPA: NAD(P)-dependent alcohol dehydrogenase [Pyrinomonadaceae bacterium]|nr:NAD(P)-dependent alcohol dehydrogenase [Pyrinomonadaceae bacterium]HMP66013.1 NAD(P)-dependent alcohol dehydrogenase [Pyrinomonadaceae bacterium]
MKAIEIQKFGLDGLAIVDRPVSEPGPGEVLIKFHAASVNRRDLMVAEGTYNPRMKLPAIPLSDGAGEIDAVGSGVHQWSVGDRVMPIFAQRWFDGDPSAEIRRTSLGAGPFWDGVMREFGVFSADSIVRIPDHLSYEEAATLPCAALTAWNALVESGKLKAGDTVLTLGTGGVSLFAVQFAKMFGARVIATTSSDAKAVRLKDLGADETINYMQFEAWEEKVLELTNGPGVDHVVEVGGADTLPRSIRSVRLGGHIALIGALSGGTGFDAVSVFMKSIRLQGIYVGSKRMFLEMNRAISANQMAPVLDKVYEFEEIAAALVRMRSGEHFGKIAVRIGSHR